MPITLRVQETPPIFVPQNAVQIVEISPREQREFGREDFEKRRISRVLLGI
jgi:hypothetical protein